MDFENGDGVGQHRGTTTRPKQGLFPCNGSNCVRFGEFYYSALDVESGDLSGVAGGDGIPHIIDVQSAATA